MATARDIVKGALRKLHKLGTGQSLDTDEANDALAVLNMMLGSFSVDDAIVWEETKETFTISASQDSYTIGSGGDFNTTRPLSVKAVFVSVGDSDYSLAQMDEKQYAAITQKGVTSIPDQYYYDAGYPLGRFYFYTKADGIDSVTIYSRKAITQFTDLDTAFAMPDEYRAMLEYNLAVWLSPEYEMEASPTVKRIARQTYDAVASQNTKNENNLAHLDVPSGENMSVGDIYSGYMK